MSTSTIDSTVSIGVGIDTARHGHSVSFLRGDRQMAARPLTVLENADGYQQFERELRRLHERHPQAVFHVHIDAAGQYSANLERFLRSLPLPLQISIGEPNRNQHYHKAVSPKRRTDQTESLAMARFGVVEQPPSTREIPDEFQVLCEIGQRLRAQSRDTTRTINRLHNLLSRVFPELQGLISDLNATWVLKLLETYPTPETLQSVPLETLQKIPFLRTERARNILDAARHSVGSRKGPLVESLVRELASHLLQSRNREKTLEKLLVQAYRALPHSGHVHILSIPGIGPLTAAALVAKIVSLDRFARPENLVAYFGIFPEEDDSGVDVEGRPLPSGPRRMSRKGCDLVRGYLWNAAKAAVQRNPAVRELYARLTSRGARGDVALGHCMRKLLHQVFGVWASQQPFDEQRARTGRARPTRSTEPAGPSPEKPEAVTPPLEAVAESPKTETAAGHNREPVPDRSVVTAAASRLEPVSSSSVSRAETRGTIDYGYLREQVGLEQILSRIGVLPKLRGATQRRGRCPLCGTDHTLSANLQKNAYQCFHPGCSRGNALDFWAAYHRLPLHQAAQHLAETFGLQTQRPEPTRLTPKPGRHHARRR